MILFGSGLMWSTPLQNAVGAAVANPTPLLLGVLQDCEVDIKRDLKELYGQNQFPVMVAAGKGSVNGKAKFADFYGGMLETLIFGQAGSAGLTSMVNDTTGTAVPATPFQITVTPPSSGAFAADLGVISAATGRPMTRVASGPTTGQYSLAGAVYTFAVADVGLIMYINYRYTATSAVARKGVLNNLPMGQAPTFRTDLYVPYNGEQLVLTFANCITDGFKLGSKNDDFTVPEFGFKCFADSAGKVLDWATAE